ncbi:hypothetical protein HYV79_04245 [Candidatus Woesearchaeota archaeon]|nr:hypothetical protein [Candidatus Woesearchaeota archaeon]
MSRLEFDRELEEYISERRRAGVFNNLLTGWKSKTQSSVDLNPAIETYSDSIETNDHQLQATEQVQSNGFFSRLLSRKSTVKQEENERVVVEEINPIREDLRQVSKITIEVLKKLSHTELEKFKNSEEFILLKMLLRKNKLIK